MVIRDDGSAAAGQPMMLAGHSVEFDSAGRMMPWASWNTALDLEMNFYQLCPLDHGYPRFAFTTFMDGGWEPFPDRTDTIPATQNGVGILSYLKFYELRGRQDRRFLRTAGLMGACLVNETLTPPPGRYPPFTRSAANRADF